MGYISYVIPAPQSEFSNESYGMITSRADLRLDSAFSQGIVAFLKYSACRVGRRIATIRMKVQSHLNRLES